MLPGDVVCSQGQEEMYSLLITGSAGGITSSGACIGV